MASASGIEAQLGIADEVTYGTFVAPARWYEFVSESLKLNITRMESQALRAQRQMLHRWRRGVSSVTGDITMELTAQDLGLWLKHLLGTPVTTGTDPYTHTWAGPGSIDDRSLSIQVGRPTFDGTTQPFDYKGCKITQATFSCSTQEYARVVMSIYGRDEATGGSLGTPSYDTELAPFTWFDGTLTVAGGSVPVTDFEFTINRNLMTDRHRLVSANSGLPQKAIQNGKTAVTGSFTADFENLTQYLRYVNSTESALVFTLNAGADKQLTFTMNVRFDGETPNVEGPQALDLPQQFVAVGATDASALTVVLVNSDSAP